MRINCPMCSRKVEDDLTGRLILRRLRIDVALQVVCFVSGFLLAWAWFS